MKLKIDLTTENGSLWISSSKLGGFLHLYFYATVVLVMDLYVNRAAGEERARKDEIQAAIETLEHAKQQSVAASMFLDSLMAALRKHSIRLQSHHQGGRGRDEIAPEVTAAGDVPRVASHAFDRTVLNLDDQPLIDIDFDALWQSGYFQAGANKN